MKVLFKGALAEAALNSALGYHNLLRRRHVIRHRTLPKDSVHELRKKSKFNLTVFVVSPEYKEPALPSALVESDNHWVPSDCCITQISVLTYPPLRVASSSRKLTLCNVVFMIAMLHSAIGWFSYMSYCGAGMHNG